MRMVVIGRPMQTLSVLNHTTSTKCKQHIYNKYTTEKKAMLNKGNTHAKQMHHSYNTISQFHIRWALQCIAKLRIAMHAIMHFALPAAVCAFVSIFSAAVVASMTKTLSNITVWWLMIIDRWTLHHQYYMIYLQHIILTKSATHNHLPSGHETSYDHQYITNNRKQHQTTDNGWVIGNL